MSDVIHENDLVCLKCGVPLSPKKVCFEYLGFNFDTELPCCPVCGAPYISEELVTGRMKEVEESLEDK